MTDKRTEASRARALVGLVVERNRLREAIDHEEAALETCRFFGIPAFQIAAGERRLALLKSELAEITPNRPTGTYIVPPEEGETDAA
jgi:hypothetical protein